MDSLGSDLDDEDEEETEELNDQKCLVLCQYDKVTRIKTKWRASLKDGIMHLNGTDYAFHRANGEFEWF